MIGFSYLITTCFLTGPTCSQCTELCFTHHLLSNNLKAKTHKAKLSCDGMNNFSMKGSGHKKVNGLLDAFTNFLLLTFILLPQTPLFLELFPENICIFVQCFVYIFADEIRDWGKLTHNLCWNMSVPWCLYNRTGLTLSGCVIQSSGSVWVLAFGSSLLLASCWDTESCCSPALLLLWVFSSNPVSGQMIHEIISHIMTSVWRWHLTAALLQFSNFLPLLSGSAVTLCDLWSSAARVVVFSLLSMVRPKAMEDVVIFGVSWLPLCPLRASS